MRTPPFLFSREKLFYQRRESSSYSLEIEGIFQLCPRKYFTYTIDAPDYIFPIAPPWTTLSPTYESFAKWRESFYEFLK